ncbi:MAG: hypothetical protein R3F43_05635 [bacterium]
MTALEAARSLQGLHRRVFALGEAWDAIHHAGADGLPDACSTARLIKLGIALGAQRSGPVHSSVRRPWPAASPRPSWMQVVALGGHARHAVRGGRLRWVREEGGRRWRG